jgi:single-strand DNA-binding protein
MQMLDSNRQQGEQAASGDNSGYNQPRFNNNQGGGYNNNNNNQGGYGNQGGYNNNQNNQSNSYGNNNPGGFAPKQQPAPAAAAPADLDDDLPF